MAPLLNTALGGYWGATRIRRIYKGDQPMIPGWINQFTNPNMFTSATPRVIRTNYVTNPSFETNLTGWSTQGAPTRTREVTDGFVGDCYSRQVATAVAVAVRIASSTIAVTVGEAYSFSFYARGTPGRSAYPRITWSDATTTDGAPVVLTGQWQRVSMVGVTPVGVTTASCVPSMGETGVVVGDVFDVDAVMYERTMPVLMAYFDGTFAAAENLTYSWSGTEHASTSRSGGVGTAGFGGYFSPTTWQTSEHETGTFGVAFQKTSVTQSAAGLLFPVGNVTPAVDVGDVLSAWARVKAAPGVEIRLEVRTSGGGGSGRMVVIGDGTWQDITTTIVAVGPGSHIAFQIHTNTNGGIVYIDRIMAVVGKTTFYPFRDGTFPGWGWDGAVEDSTSSGWN